MSAPIRLGTRASVLATTQSRWVGDRLTAALGREVELVEITTEGDRASDPLAQLGGTGVFVSALRDALLDGRIDVAVHSLKDLPTAPAPGLALAAVPAARGPARRRGRPRRAHPGRAAGRQPRRHRLTAPRCPAARPRPRFGDRRHPRQCGLADPQGPRGCLRRRRPRPRRAGPPRPPRRGHRGPRPAADAAGAGAGCTGRRDAGGRRPGTRARRPGRRPLPGRGHRRACGAGDAGRRLLGTDRGAGGGRRGRRRRRALGESGSALARRDAGGADVRHRRPGRRRRRRRTPRRADARRGSRTADGRTARCSR